MDLSLSESEQMLQDSVRTFVERQASRRVLVDMDGSGRTWQPDWLEIMASAGWLGTFVPEELGGTDASTTAAVVLFEELGRGPVPGPLIASSAVSALVLRRLAPSTTRDLLLSGISTGAETVIPALRDPETSWQGVGPTTAGLDGSLRLSCTKLFVPYADSATHFLVSVRGQTPESVRMAAVPATAPGVAVKALEGFLRAGYEVTFTNVELDPDQVLEGPTHSELNVALAPALVTLSAYAAGGIGATLDMSVEYANSREQFGIPIGRFQRVQDHIVRIVNAGDAVRWTAYEAAWAVDQNLPGAAGRAHLTAAVAGDAYIEAANAAHEVHAGIGSDPRFGLVLYTQASRTLYEYLGPPEWHRLQIAEHLEWAS